MIKKIVIGLIVSQFSYAASCKLVDNQGLDPYEMGGKKLSVFWSQEYAGTDLVREEMKLIDSGNDVDFAIYDSGFEKEYINLKSEIDVDIKYSGRGKLTGHHGTSVANIINGKAPYGVSDRVNYIALKNVKLTSTYRQEFKKYEKANSYPKIISNSYGWSKSQDIKDISLRADELGILWFLAAGNDYPMAIADVEDTSGTILIGSYAPSGLQSSFSQVSKNVAVLAPADDMQATIDGKGLHSEFGGTSGATPLVSGTAANIVSLLPMIDRTEFIKLLKISSLKSYEQAHNIENNPGLFNAYKAVHIARKISLICETLECIRVELDNEDNRIFEAIETDLSISEILSDESDCSKRKKALKNIRRNSLLLNSKSSWTKLKTVYEALGYSKNAEFYENMAEAFIPSKELKKRMEDNAIALLKQDRYFDSYMRYQESFGYKYQFAVASLLVNDTSLSGYWLSEYLMRFKDNLDQRVEDYLKASLKFASEDVKQDILSVIYR